MLRDAAARKTAEDGSAVGLEAGVAPHPERRAGRECEQVRKKVPRLVHQIDCRLAIRNSHVDVQAEDEQGPGQLLEFLDDAVVPEARGQDLVLPVGEGVGAGGGHGQADTLGTARQFVAYAEDFVLELMHVLAYLRAHLDNGLVELPLDLIPQRRRARFEQLRDVGAQPPRLGIDYLELLLHTEREAVGHAEG